ncbi:unnamed protein product [Linum trigynum]|uniref:RNase H type-1 domain-containing protein n=1 Tax=Linum trigynum TaxID=586398 RepID=A0AAV2FTN6_9ROSI
MRQYNQQVDEWLRVPVEQDTPFSGPVLPPSGTASGSPVICMWDGATQHGSHSARGVVLMTRGRDTLMARGGQFPCIDDPVVVEVLALREAVWWCLENGFTEVCFEGDAKVIIDKIIRAEIGDTRMGAILEEIVSCFALHPGFSVWFVGRRNNRVAHMVARQALSLSPTAGRLFDFQT